MTANQILNKIDRITMNPREASDKRRVLGEEAIALRAVLNSAPYFRGAADIAAAIAEAKRVVALWDGY